MDAADRASRFQQMDEHYRKLYGPTPPTPRPVVRCQKCDGSNDRPEYTLCSACVQGPAVSK